MSDTSPTPAAERCRLRFSLRSLFLTMTAIGCVAGYIRAYPRESFQLIVFGIALFPVCLGIEAIAYGIRKLVGRMH